MLKANKQKPGKWSIDEIIYDLSTLNTNIKHNPTSYHWGLHVKEVTGKTSFTLKDFVNWDITKWLENFK